MRLGSRLKYYAPFRVSFSTESRVGDEKNLHLEILKKSMTYVQKNGFSEEAIASGVNDLGCVPSFCK